MRKRRERGKEGMRERRGKWESGREGDSGREEERGKQVKREWLENENGMVRKEGNETVRKEK